MSDELIVTNPEPDADEERLNALEQKIEHSLTSAPDAFEEIKRDQLYRGRYASIEDYVLERWIKSEQQFHRYNSFFEVRDLLEDVGKSTAGLSKRIARQLSISPTPEELKEILNVAKEKARKNRKVFNLRVPESWDNRITQETQQTARLLGLVQEDETNKPWQRNS